MAALTGAVAAGAYLRLEPVRTFATFLTPAAVIVPAVFLLNPGVSRLLAPGRRSGRARRRRLQDPARRWCSSYSTSSSSRALLDRDGNIDRAAFPNFAALADTATWFRNATAVGEMTAYALPAVLTGAYPSPRHPAGWPPSIR